MMTTTTTLLSLPRLRHALIGLLAASSLATPVALAEQPISNDAAIARELDVFNNLYKELNAYYVDTLDAQATIERAIGAMLDGIDPYTEYIPASQTDDLMTLTTGEYGGIGSYIIERRDGDKRGVYISGPYADSPAARAGMRAGDRIVMIDNDTTTQWNSQKVSQRLKGQPNTHVRVQVVRPYATDSVKTFDLVRETIHVNPVPYYGVTRNHLGYIALTTYNQQSASQVREALLALKANPAVKGIVLDLRGNGGGIVEAAIGVVGCFVPRGTQVVMMRGRDKASERIYKTTTDPVDTKIPLVVLVDGGSASASEITAGALQDLDRAVIVGTRSYGKGLVQSTRPLPYDAMLKVTIARYYTPSGRLIQELDYSHRNADGSYSKTIAADSLGRVYYTAHGREVHEGGGITPDIKVEPKAMTRVVYNIVSDQWAFDYATRYVAQHPTIAPAGEFEITDEIFNDFKQYVDADRFEYDKVCEQQLERLRQTAKVEGYMNDSTQAAIDHLARLLKHDLDHDLDIHREEIAQVLAQEIVGRYYYQSGQVEQSIKHDECLDHAQQLLEQSGEYCRILHLDNKNKTKGKQ